MTPLKATYVSRTGTIVQMKAVEAELHKRGFALVADETRKKKPMYERVLLTPWIGWSKNY